MHDDHEDQCFVDNSDTNFVGDNDDLQFQCDKKTASEPYSIVDPSLYDCILSDEEECIDPWIKHKNSFPSNLEFKSRYDYVSGMLSLVLILAVYQASHEMTII